LFSLELAKVFIEENNLSKLSAFFIFCLKVSQPPYLRARPEKTFKPFFGYSIVKHLKNTKGAVTFELLKRNLRYRS
jgi:hypothetical protein